ncbi:MAG: hypothetical protein JSW38_01775 [Dehalococcoidia bacterium]|nr:MAG: hypothetical protein JSV02_04830 [Dehalococcoidia bacterium]UCG83572.1 MAG: hypothetical protein JSW38_01775 [Dehalococcoidia bacterium]
MNIIEIVKPYRASINDEILYKCNGSVRIWSEPKPSFDGAIVVDEITTPINVTVLEVQKNTDDSLILRAKIHYGEGHEGWVPCLALTDS